MTLTVANTTQQVHIIDDDEAVRDSMSMLLESADIACCCFDTAEAFFEHFNDSLRGCLILDIRMPGMSGLELQTRLKQSESMLPIIFITGHGDVPMAVEAMRQGAFDFMRKPILEKDLLDRIQQAFDHESGIRTEWQNHDHNSQLIASLTKREHQIFACVAEGQANKSIAIDFGISERTVEVHRSQVMKKLGANNLAQLVRIHIELGRH
jgi:two-component system response regulator FixJ